MHVPFLAHWWQTAGRFIFFEHCRACGCDLRPGEVTSPAGLKAVCAQCWTQIDGRPPLFQWCRLDEGPCFPIVSGAYYRAPLKKLIYRLKYDSDRLLVSDLSLLLNTAWLRVLPSIEIAWNRAHQDQQLAQEFLKEILLVPIPLHPQRQRARGFNHATLLAEQFAQVVKLPLEHRAMKRIKNTAPQHGLKRQQRMENLSGAFECDHKLVAGKAIILVDDIFTSGSTLAEAARTLLSAGASCVAGITVARAV